MEQLSLLDRFNNWVKESVIIKLMFIGILMLILMIPSAMVDDLIAERQNRAAAVIQEVSSKWASSQTVTGPILKIPYKQIENIKEYAANGTPYTRVYESIHTAYFLPDELVVNGTVAPEERHRGIFDVVVYDSKLNIKSTFGDIKFDKWNIPDAQVMWSDAELLLGVKDMQGIYENPKISSGEQTFTSESSADLGIKVSHIKSEVDYRGERVETSVEMPATGIVVSFDWKGREDILTSFNIDVPLKGSERLYFVPAGKSTSVTLSGNWPSPSFDGKMLPTTSEVNNGKFQSNWKVLSYNRAIADQWIDAEQSSFGGTEFGVKLLIAADQYQKSMRTAKYDGLIILLAFTALLLVEITRKVRIHPFQYILVGVALIVYYTLLLSISEHTDYNTAYAIASAATVLLLALYSITFLRTKPLVVFFSLVMSMFYVFIFVIIQAEDYSLLIGSVGLFVITAVVMYFSRNIKWYKDEIPATQTIQQP